MVGSMDNPGIATKLWFITGASSGFGLALARVVIASGGRVIVTTRDGSVPDLGDVPSGVCAAYALDVGDVDACGRLAARVIEEHGAPDVVVNNAGAARLAPVETGADALWRETFAVNLFGPMALTRGFLTAMAARGSGQLVYLGAAAAVGNYPGFAAYGGAKAALEAASDSLRAEVAPHGLGVTLVLPGPFRTRFVASALARSASIPPAYARTVGRFARQLAAIDGRQPGDPTKAAAVLLGYASEGRWPDRVAFGEYMANKLADRAAVLSAVAGALHPCPFDAAG